MPTLEDVLSDANLSRKCKIDLLNHVEQIENNSSMLQKRPVTMPDDELPAAVHDCTFTHNCKRCEQSEEQQQRFLSQKSQKLQTQDTIAEASVRDGTTFFKEHKTRYQHYPHNRDPFRASRNRGALTGKDQDFVYRYAEALTGGPVEREVRDDAASREAQKAYREAFTRYTGREPTAKEMAEADKLYFGFDENGAVGVVQKPHPCTPHSHYGYAHSRPCKCRKQVFTAEPPVARAARDRFPGPVPVWSSTKNLSTMVAGDMHEPGHKNTRGISQRAKLDTVVGTK